MPFSSSPRRSRRRRRRHRKKKAKPLSLVAFHALPAARDWAALPVDLILSIFHRVDHVDLLLCGPAGVCRSWRRAATDEPELWRHVDMRGYAQLSFRASVDFHGMARTAVRRSAGQCQAFWSECAGDDDFLLYLADQAPMLRSLRLISCYDISKEAFVASINKFPLLEELELSLCLHLSDPDVLEVVAKSCPQMKHFLNVRHSVYGGYQNWDSKAMAIAGFRCLRSLELHSDSITNQGLTAIIDNCPHLELLILRNCPNVTMDDTLLAKCSRINRVTLRGDEYDDYDVSPATSEFCLSCAIRMHTDYEYLGDGFFVEDLADYYDYSRYLNGVYVTDFDDDEDARMRAKSTRRYLKISTEV
ncbi:hypothetical protein ACP70R_045235 [Stipagrostis hirtigluma subsp. patula]